MYNPPQNPPLRLALLQGPDWWYESWGLDDWLDTLFNQPVEVHAFLLGGFIGLLLASVAASRHPRTTLTLTLAVVLFTFGTFETVFICSDEFTACRHLRVKPWYFIAGYLSAHLLSQGVLRRTARYHPEPESENRTAASPVAGLLVLVLVGLAAYSFVSPTPVHPITGLATVGGVAGSMLGLVAYEWADASVDADPTFRETVRRVLWQERAESVLVVGYGAVMGFGYPRLFWEAGEFVGTDGFLFGDIVWARNGLPSVVAYVFALFVLAVVLQRFQLRGQQADRLGGQRFAALVLGFVTYAFCLFLATGYAGIAWFRLIPAA